MSSKKAHKIALVGDSGGHLDQLLALREWWSSFDRFWVTFRTPDAESGLAGERVYWCHHPTNRNLPNLARNTLLAARILLRERPTVILSTGAGSALPYFFLGRLAGIRTVYLEVYDRVQVPSLTGRIVYPIADKFLLQWEKQRAFYPRGIHVGALF